LDLDHLAVDLEALERLLDLLRDLLELLGILGRRGRRRRIEEFDARERVAAALLAAGALLGGGARLGIRAQADGEGGLGGRGRAVLFLERLNVLDVLLAAGRGQVKAFGL